MASKIVLILLSSECIDSYQVITSITMNKFILLSLITGIFFLMTGKVSATPRLNWQSAEFEGRRVIAEGAFKTMREAQHRGEFLYFKYGFQNIGVLYIPVYENLSGKRLYQTIIVPEGNCDRFLNRYSNKIDRDAYCFNPSNNGIPADRRGMKD